MRNVRAADASDAEAISRLIRELGYRLSPSDVAAQLSALPKTDSVFVALSGVAVAGFASVHTLPYFHTGTRLCRVTALAVDPTHRGEGFGRQLMLACDGFARRQGCSAMEVTSALTREDAHGFYRQLGYSGVALKFAKSVM